MGKANITIRDIAAACHASTASVSRALNAKPGVGDDLRKQILACARAVGYVPDSVARSMRLRTRKRTYIVVRKGKEDPAVFRLPYKETLYAQLDTDVQILTLGFSTDLITTLQRVESTYSPQLFAIVGPCLIRDQSRFSQIHTPLLFIASDDAPQNYPSLVSDDFEGSAAVVNSMIAAGHRRIAVLSESNTGMAAYYPDRIAGYKHTLAQHGIPFDPSLVHAVPVDYGSYLSSSRDILQQAVTPWADGRHPFTKSPPTAVFALSDFLAFALISVLWNAGIRVPERLSVASFGDWELIQFLPILIHSWVQPLDDFAEAMFTAMSCILQSKPFPRTIALHTHHPDGTHGSAYAISPNHLAVSGYLREGASLAAPRSSQTAPDTPAK